MQHKKFITVLFLTDKEIKNHVEIMDKIKKEYSSNKKTTIAGMYPFAFNGKKYIADKDLQKHYRNLLKNDYEVYVVKFNDYAFEDKDIEEACNLLVMNNNIKTINL